MSVLCVDRVDGSSALAISEMSSRSSDSVVDEIDDVLGVAPPEAFTIISLVNPLIVFLSSL